MILSYLLGDRADLPGDDAWLGPAEVEWLTGNRTPKRIADWRLGRWTSKKALRAVLEAAGDAPPSAAEILAAGDGAPFAKVGGTKAPVTLSLSHRSGQAVCFVGPAGIRLGCDLERIEPRSDEFVETYLTAGERETVRRAGCSCRPLTANLIWSAKESFLKALRQGLRIDARQVEIELGPEPTAGAWSELEARGLGAALTGRWRCDGDLVLTVVSDPACDDIVVLAR